MVTRLNTCIVYNIHLPWVHPESSPQKIQRNEHIVKSLQKHIISSSPSITQFVIGDLNLSSSHNEQLCHRYFHSPQWSIQSFGESYKLSPETVHKRKTFRAIDGQADDGCILMSPWKSNVIHMENSTIRNKTLPVDHTGLFKPLLKSTYPSDHMLVSFVCYRE